MSDIARGFFFLETEIIITEGTTQSRWVSLDFTSEYSATDYTKMIFILEMLGT